MNAESTPTQAAIFDPADLREDIDLEAKRAGGLDGKGALPRNLFETYSAFANTDGGVILLGAVEREDRGFDVAGVEQADQVIGDLWNQLNNPQKVSVNLLDNAAVRKHPTGNGGWVIEITVPRASRKERPVFVNGNPLTGTYKRQSTGDYRCRDDEVRRMMAEQVHDLRDTQRFPGYGLKHLDRTSFNGYRQRFRDTDPGHPWSDIKDEEFLLRTGCSYRDGDTGETGLTLAGLLMFGELHWINQEIPHYFLDYRELPVNDTWTEWDDRLTPDGTWSGNLYDFYMLTIRRLVRDVKVPFRLEGDRRVQETPVHKALRESLVNVIVHADYSGRVPILVIKAPDYFEFRHSGRMRVSVEQALRGGTSDCRNGTMQKMFRLIGLGEQAGSGIPRVLENWKSQHYRLPELRESLDPEATHMRLRTVSLLPGATLATLRQRFGGAFETLEESGRLTLATVEIEGFVTNRRLQQILSLHPRDITALLGKLVEAGMLNQDGRGRAASYRLAGAPVVDLASDSDAGGASPSSLHKGAELPTQGAELPTQGGRAPYTRGPSSLHKGAELPTQGGRAPYTRGPSSLHKGAELPTQGGRAPYTRGPRSLHKGWPDPVLQRLSEPVSNNLRAAPDVTRKTILAICRGRFLTLGEIAELLNRSPEGLRQRFVRPMVDEEKVLERRFPQQPNHERQAYRTREPDDE